MGYPEVGPGPHAPAQSSLPEDPPLGVHRGRPPNSPTSGGVLGTGTQTVGLQPNVPCLAEPGHIPRWGEG